MENQIIWNSKHLGYNGLNHVFEVNVLREGEVIATKQVEQSYSPKITLPELEGEERGRVEVEIIKHFSLEARNPYIWF